MNISSLTENGENFAEPLKCDMIRWFYKEKNHWVAFLGYDSLRLEDKYRLINEVDVTNITNFQKVIDDYILVKGNLWKANIIRRKLYSIFSINLDDDDDPDPVDIIRGTWFHNYSHLPLESEQLSNKIEDQHLKLFGTEESKKKRKETNIVAKVTHKVSKQLKLRIFSMDFEGFNIEWGGIQDVFINKPSIKQYLLDKVGLGRVGNRISRGYHEIALENDKQSNIDHLCFIFEGIGKTLGYNNIFEKCFDFSKVFEKIKSLGFSNFTQKVEFIPVNWKKTLLFNDKIFEIVSPSNNFPLRMIINSSVLDILHYSNPILYKNIIECIKSELNRIFSIFCEHNEYFLKNNGKISIIAHSQASVFVYDILSNWSTQKQYDDWKEFEGNSDKNTGSTDQSKSSEIKNVQKFQLRLFEQKDSEMNLPDQLNFPFKIDYLFLLGSPLAIFLAFRGFKPNPDGVQEDLIKSCICRRIYNIFHPCDPLVYRIEPLINNYYNNLKPVKISKPEYLNKLSLSTLSHRMLFQSDIEDIPGNQFQSWDKRYFTTDVPEINTVEYSDDENITETLIKSLSNIGMETKDTYDHSSSKLSVKAKSGTNFYYQKNMNVIERRNDSNVVYTIKAVTLHDLSSKESNCNENPLFNTGDRNKQELNNMNLFRPNMSNKKTTDYRSDHDTQSEIEIHKTLQWRIDYTLPQNPDENLYLSALSSHESYWTSEDLCYFMLSQFNMESFVENDFS